MCTLLNSTLGEHKLWSPLILQGFFSILPAVLRWLCVYTNFRAKQEPYVPSLHMCNISGSPCIIIILNSLVEYLISNPQKKKSYYQYDFCSDVTYWSVRDPMSLLFIGPQWYIMNIFRLCHQSYTFFLAIFISLSL